MDHNGKPVDPYTLAIVYWLDAHTDTAEYEFCDVGRMHFGWPTITVGHLLRDDAAGVTVATDIRCGTDGEPDTYFGLHFIPKGCITSIKLFRRQV